MAKGLRTAPGQSDEGLISERVADQVRRAILAGDFQPGSRVRQEDLAGRFGASRIPVREALRQLESEGLVVVIPNSGAWITKIDQEKCVEIYKMRERLEPLAISESVPRLSEHDIDTMERMVQRIESVADVEDYVRIDREFHLLSYSKAAMPKLLTIVERFWNVTQHYRRVYVAATGSKGRWISDAEHRLIMEAVRRRDAQEAERVLHSHIRRTRLHIQEATR